MHINNKYFLQSKINKGSLIKVDHHKECQRPMKSDKNVQSRTNNNQSRPKIIKPDENTIKENIKQNKSGKIPIKQDKKALRQAKGQ